MSERNSASMDDSCPWTELCPSYTELASRNKQHLDFLDVYDRSLVSVGRKIGEGGQGCVYEAKLHLPYSFKPVPVVVKKFKSFEGVSQGHFPREMASVKSYNLCLPIGVFFEGDSLCMIMKRFSCDLRAAINSRMKALRDKGFGTNGLPFTEGVRRLIILQLALGLKALHECGVYHGDLKAANILLRTIGKNYERSLSLAHPIHLAIADFERSEGVGGTAFWRAPEVLRYLPKRPPFSKEQWFLTDIYSFGMVCYEVLTGKIPFQGHPSSDYGLVLNGGRPKLPDNVSQYWRDLIVQCWHVDPHSRPSWTDIIAILAHQDVAHETQNFKSEINDLVSVESLSFQSLIYESKQLVQDLTLLHESDSKSFKSEFMPYYWASKLIATIEEYASKFEVDSFLKSPLMCNVQESFERIKLCSLLRFQLLGVSFVYSAFLDLSFEQQLDVLGYAQKNIPHRERLLGMLRTLCHKVIQECRKVHFTEEFEIGTTWIGRLFFFQVLVQWVLWYEHVEDGWGRKLMIKLLLPTHWTLDIVAQTLLIIFCMIVNTYIYVLAMITYEPILLVLQYGLYKIKGCNNILYRSSGDRICRFQRVWMNYTRYKVVSIILIFSFVILLTMYRWKGIFGWILFPCTIICTPYWRRPLIVG